MDYQKLITTIVEVCVIPLLGILTTYLIQFLKRKAQELAAKTENELAEKYIMMLDETIASCVMATTQTYVETLKKENAFTTEAQKEAFAMTYSNVISILSEDCLTYLTEVYEDLSKYIENKIESEVKLQKQ